jgi:hypothetical protein
MTHDGEKAMSELGENRSTQSIPGDDPSSRVRAGRERRGWAHPPGRPRLGRRRRLLGVGVIGLKLLPH